MPTLATYNVSLQYKIRSCWWFPFTNKVNFIQNIYRRKYKTNDNDMTCYVRCICLISLSSLWILETMSVVLISSPMDDDIYIHYIRMACTYLRILCAGSMRKETKLKSIWQNVHFKLNKKPRSFIREFVCILDKRTTDEDRRRRDRGRQTPSHDKRSDRPYGPGEQNISWFFRYYDKEISVPCAKRTSKKDMTVWMQTYEYIHTHIYL